MYRNGINAYRQTDMVTADPSRLVITCYEGIITNLKTARRAIYAKDFEKKAVAIQKIYDVLALLTQSLNFEKGGEIAKNLEALYNYSIRRLMEAARENDNDIIEEITCIMEKLAGAWKNISRPQREFIPKLNHPLNYNLEENIFSHTRGNQKNELL